MKHSILFRAAAFLCAFALLIGMQVLTARTALAGYNEVIVCTDGKGAAAYAASSGSKKAGILYNGFWEEISLDDDNERNSCMLTGDYTVWLNVDKATNRAPVREKGEDYDAWRDRRACNIFLAEIAADGTPLYSTPDHKRLSAKHVKGTVMAVCGEFGGDYYVTGAQRGFVSQSAVKKISDMTFSQAHSETYIWGEPEKMTLYASETEPVWPASSASGYTDDMLYGGYTSNAQVRVLRDLGDWVQLVQGRFVEKRFLDPDGDHSYPAAWVKTDGALDRLNIRSMADTDSSVEVKLCSGTQVRVISRTDKWAVVLVTGPNGGKHISGCALAKYLNFDSADAVRNGSVQVLLTQDLHGNKEMTDFRENGKGDVLPAGTPLTVIGVYEQFSSKADQVDRYLCETEDGRYIEVESAGILEPVSDSGITAAVRSAARLRKAPDPDAGVIRQLKAKTKVEVLLRGEIWTMVKYKGETGFMMSRYLSFP